ncbi:TPA: DUF2213 domain-containing protein [Vibrio harveyi]|nr:DUF2213 domain-containing protein [Vibrio harveyi]HEQ3599241.1 DUF2213 domain-containing protein [Vibrio harveyi]HEQ3611299.1 DUF2213 domain-containing protein [Vibrio harveyi]
MNQKISHTILCDSSTREKTKEGFLKVVIRATRTGVMRYSVNDLEGVEDIHGTGFVNVARLPEDVFDKSSLETMRTASVTDEHPGERVVNSDNYKRANTGHVTGDAYHDEHDVYVPAIIKDSVAVKNIELGKSEVSVGADASVHRSSGELHGQSYDYTFKNINYNHISVVQKGRAGNALILDNEDNGDSMDKEKEIERLTKLNDEQSRTITSLNQRLENIERDSVINDAKKIDPDFQPEAGQSINQIKVSFINDSAITENSPQELIDYAFRNLSPKSPNNPPVVELGKDTTNANSSSVNDSADDEPKRQPYNQWDKD